jgi:3',5'-cyclic AMP phosphodiesterase CpdA
MFESESASHVIAHISDTHVLGGDRKLFSTVDVAQNLTRILDRLRAGDQRIDALVFTGDLADIAEVEAYQRLRGLVEPVAAELGAQIVWVMGNHDERNVYSRELFDDESDDVQDRVYNVGGLRIVSLDTSVPGYHHGAITDAQLEWLGAELATPADHGTVLAMHHPPLVAHSPLVRLIELENMDLLEPIVRGSDVRAILAGHLHYSSFGNFAGVPVSVASATCYTVDLGADKSFLLSAVDGAQSIQLIHLYDDSVVTSVIPADVYPQVSGYPATLRAMVDTMTFAELREMISNKTSDFNSAERAQSADL